MNVQIFLHLNGLFRGARRYEALNLDVTNHEANIFVDSVEISKLRNTAGHPCDPKVNQFDKVLVDDIMRNVSCGPYYIEDRDIRNCTSLDNIKDLNGYLDLKNTFSIFKTFHRKPCANFAMTFKEKVKKVIYKDRLKSS